MSMRYNGPSATTSGVGRGLATSANRAVHPLYTCRTPPYYLPYRPAGHLRTAITCRTDLLYTDRLINPWVKPCPTRTGRQGAGTGTLPAVHRGKLINPCSFSQSVQFCAKPWVIPHSCAHSVRHWPVVQIWTGTLVYNVWTYMARYYPTDDKPCLITTWTHRCCPLYTVYTCCTPLYTDAVRHRLDNSMGKTQGLRTVGTEWHRLSITVDNCTTDTGSPRVATLVGTLPWGVGDGHETVGN